MAVFVVCALLAHPVVNSGIIDDWSYIWTAKRLAETGHLEYNGWANAILGWQLYLGALLIKLFGFSWTVVRLTVILVTVGGLALFHRVMVRLGCPPRDAAIVVLGLSCCNIFLMHGVTFMSDASGWLTILVCLYLCIRTFQANTDRAAALWIASASLSNMMLGTVRQVAWLGALVMVPAVVWALRKRPFVFRAGLGASIASFAGIGMWMRWWNHVPYAIHEKLFFFHMGQVFQAPWFTLSIFVYATPVLVAFLILGQLRWPSVLGAVIGAILGLTLPEMRTHWGVGPLGPENELPLAITVVLSAIVFASSFAFLNVAWIVFRDKTHSDAPTLRLRNQDLFWLLIPYTLMLGFLLYTRGALWPRYWLPMLPVSAVMIMWVFYRWKPDHSLPGACFIVIALVSLSSVAYVNTLFAQARALVIAEQEYLAAGYPRSQLQAGFASDGMYEILLHGYINDYRITTPRKVYYQPKPTLPKQCLKPMWELMPSIDRQFSLQQSYGGCFQPMGLPAVDYEAKFPPFKRQIVITRITPSAVTP
jgi:hypothetical protein